jgi:hypothetical protein
MRERHRFEPRVRAERTKNLPYVVSDGLAAEMEGRRDLVGGRALASRSRTSFWRFVRWTALAARGGLTTAMPKTRLIRLVAFDDYRADLGATARPSTVNRSVA